MTFDEAQRMFRDERIRELAAIPDGLRFLKLRSLSRREHLEELFGLAAVTPQATQARLLFREAYENQAVDTILIDSYIRTTYASERNSRRQREPEIVNQLYRMQVFDWGGLHQNSLEKTIVDNYVKKITDYDTLSDKIENELHSSMRGYVLCSWYNHWTSIIIEDVFRDHPAVLPAVGLVKKIDFFIHDVPFDLKVTYLPEGFIKEQRRVNNLRPELTLLKQKARRLNIPFDSDLPDARLLEDLWSKHRDHPSEGSRELISELHGFRASLLDECRNDPTTLIRWLYENQGVRRFDASNRLFLVLVDTANFFESWKLKRAKPLLDERIHGFLEDVGANPGREIAFRWDGAEYTTVSDAVFVVHP
ncbi:MAG: hypothetical protein JW993_18675 [Sedimentisphaerales bacterium]|nr:hypothetical protein [Sedimentisphaerales bacterium]